jgi:hypothetical protein
MVTVHYAYRRDGILRSRTGFVTFTHAKTWANRREAFILGYEDHRGWAAAVRKLDPMSRAIVVRHAKTAGPLAAYQLIRRY